MPMTLLAAALASALVAMPTALGAPWDGAASGGAPIASRPQSPVTMAFLWAPPESRTRSIRKRRLPPITHDPGGPGTSIGVGVGAATSNKSTEALEREVFGTGVGSSAENTPSIRRRAVVPYRNQRHDQRDDQGDDQVDDNDDDDNDDGSTGRHSGSGVADLPPVIAPHLVSFGLGTALMGRSFSFNGPLQPESSSPRGGLSAQLESFPLLSHDGWFAALGLGASFDTEIGSAGVGQTDGGTLSYPVTQTRWGFDVRYALPWRDRFLIVPLLGIGHSGYNLERRAQPAPSTCPATSTQVCLPDVGVSHVNFGFDARAALTPKLSVSLSAAYLAGFGVGRGMGQLGAESDASAHGFSGALAISWQIIDWLALRAETPLTYYGYQFSRKGLSYSSASETYYGVVIGATVFTR
jgi:hypothetical protein